MASSSDSYDMARKTYELYRSYIQHEDNLVNHRTTWLITTQSFLIATFGLSYQKKYEMAHKIMELSFCQKAIDALERPIIEYNIFLLVLAFSGFSIAILTIYSVRAAQNAIFSLQGKWNSINFIWRNRMKDDGNAQLFDLFPEIIGGGSDTEKKGARFATWLPIFFAILWVIVIVFTVVTLFGVQYSVSLGPSR